jgi:hypothetical protein
MRQQAKRKQIACKPRESSKEQHNTCKQTRVTSYLEKREQLKLKLHSRLQTVQTQNIIKYTFQQWYLLPEEEQLECSFQQNY